MLFIRGLVLSLFLAPAWGVQWPAVRPAASQDVVPNLELSLAPPPHAWPQVAAELGALEEGREQMENANMNKLRAEFNDAAVRARRRIGDVIGSAMRAFDDAAATNAIHTARRIDPRVATSFRQAPQSDGAPALSVKVSVMPPSPPDPALKASIDNMEYRRSDEERAGFEQAQAELKALTDFVVHELQVQIQGHSNSALSVVKPVRQSRSTSFLQAAGGQLPAQTNVRVVPADVAYPTVASMVQDMESRRDIAEDLEKKRIMEWTLDFLAACNRAAEEGLNAAVGRILAQRKPLL